MWTVELLYRQGVEIDIGYISLQIYFIIKSGYLYSSTGRVCNGLRLIFVQANLVLFALYCRHGDEKCAGILRQTVYLVF